MFSPTLQSSEPPFIIRCETGCFNQYPLISYCMVEYESQHYSDDLFKTIRQPFPETLNSALTKRRAEHLAGRYCCSVLFKQLTGHSQGVGSHQRAPVWPAGWSGSISHTHRRAIVVIMEEKAGLYPGIDIEQHTPDLLLQTADIFSSNEEQDFMKTLSLPYSEALLINFSAKESLFKSLWYENKDIINFNFSFLSDINSIQGTYTLTLSHDISTKLHAGRKFTGNYYFMNDNVITFILSSL